VIPEVLVIKNNENINLRYIEKLIGIRKQYLNMFQYIIDKLNDADKLFIYHHNYKNIAENAKAQSKIKIANEFYSKASAYGGLSMREWLRRLAFSIYNIVKR